LIYEKNKGSTSITNPRIKCHLPKTSETLQSRHRKERLKKSLKMDEAIPPVPLVDTHTPCKKLRRSSDEGVKLRQNAQLLKSAGPLKREMKRTQSRFALKSSAIESRATTKRNESKKMMNGL